MTFNTPVATIGIRGTHFGALYCQGDCEGIQDLKGNALKDGLHADVADGTIELSNDAGNLIVDKGHFAYVKDANTKPEFADDDTPYRVGLPASVMFDESALVWSEKAQCATCALR